MSRLKPFDFGLFTDTQLQDLEKQVSGELRRRFGRRGRLRRRLQGLVEFEGPRYQNPANPSETWSGKGSPPAWVEAALISGLRLEQLEVLDDRPTVKRPERAS